MEEHRNNMKNYKIQELTPGMETHFSVKITEEMLQKFLEISGDINPLHTDAAFARAKGYPGRVAYGMLTASFYSTLAGVYLPGEHCLLWEVNSKFTAPVFVGDELDIYGKVTEVNEKFGFIRLKAQIKNQDGKTVSRAVITAGVNDGA